jgi:hypothetical protein
VYSRLRLTILLRNRVLLDLGLDRALRWSSDTCSFVFQGRGLLLPLPQTVLESVVRHFAAVDARDLLDVDLDGC